MTAMRRRLIAFGLVPVALLAGGAFLLYGHSVDGHVAIPPRVSAVPTARPSASAAPTPGVVVAGCGAVTRPVGSAGQLKAALAAARPGDAIALAPGTYPGTFVARASGTSQAPITLCGPREAVLDGGNIKTGYVFHLDGASWWKLVGFTVQNAQKGVVTDHANHVVISGISVREIGDEGIHLRSASSDNLIEGNQIRDTGLNRHKFGEGIYVGSANKNWCLYSHCGPDTSDRNVIRGNDIAGTTAENIDIKEGTTGGSIAGNRLSGAGIDPAAATAWINVKGNNWTITGNIGENSPKDGFQVHQVYDGWGENNVFRGNQANVGGPGFGIYVQSSTFGTVLSCDNVVSNAGSGSSNLDCS